MGMGENEKPPQWEWKLPALPWEFIPKGFMLDLNWFQPVLANAAIRMSI